eukprot:8179485-Alexandrium_andersonii.AAC.1
MDTALRAGEPKRTAQTELNQSLPPTPQHPRRPEDGPQGGGLLRALEERLGEGWASPGGPPAPNGLPEGGLAQR